jgi:hypothetical protein
VCCMTRETSGTHLPLGTTRTDVIDRLVGGVTPNEATVARRALLRLWAKGIALLVVALGVVVVLDLASGKGAGEIFWGHPFLFLVAPLVPVSVAIQYRRLKPRPPMSLQAAEMLAAPGPACPRCGEVPLKGALICPSCHNLLRPLMVVLPGALVLLGALLVLLYRRGAL